MHNDNRSSGIAPHNAHGDACMYNYGLIGNCQTAALISTHGSIDWCCMPRPDSGPVFGRLLDPEGGHFSIEPAAGGKGRAQYLPNTNVLVTHIACDDGSAYRITDFCPRFEQYGRMYRPIALFRMVEPLHGTPVVKTVCRVVNGWETRKLG